MNISYNWLKELIDIDLSPEQAAEALTRVGLAVEGIEPHGSDHILDIDLTSNRPDCLSHLGVARELGVITGKRLRSDAAPAAIADAIDPDAVPFPSVLAPEVIRIEARELCHRFTARIIKNVKIGPSPDWLKERLESIGERSINNVADITNYVMHELGHPMHAFDLDKLSGHRIVVRRARFGETVCTLDEIERKLDDTMLAICDADKPVSVAGVMGGFDTGITDSTVNVLLEVAAFDRESIRRTSRKLNLASEASYRFERGVDIENIKAASDRATELICEIAGGEAGDLLDMYPVPFTAERIVSNDIAAAVKRLTGIEVSKDECLRILESLGIHNDDRNTFISPSWRHDIAIEEDLVEEIARHVGYENIADELPPAFGAGEYQPAEPRKRSLRQTLSGQGFEEALSYSFIDTKFDDVYETVPGLIEADLEERFITLRDSVIEGSVRMRPTLIPGLLDALRLNLNHKRRDISLYEIGKTFAARNSEAAEMPEERELLAIAITGGERQQARALPARELDFYDAKGAVESAFEAIEAALPEFVAAEVSHLQSGQSAAVVHGGRSVGTIGRLNSEISANYKFKQPVYIAEIDLQAVLAQPVPPVVYSALPKYPSVVRDVSFLVKGAEVTLADIRKAILDQKVGICEDVEFVALYEGKEMAEGERSLTVRIEYRDAERTLTEEEVVAQHDEILANIEKTLGITPRM